MRKKTIIFDLDGTICNVTHRRKFVASKPKNWDAWNRGIALDTPNEAVKFMFESIVNRDDVEVLFVSGRSEDYREVTEAWLLDNGFDVHSNLYMRRSRDTRDDSIVKGEIADKIVAEGYDIFCVFDDRKRVVDMWVDRGIFVFDVGQGAGDF
jgi:predicted secreted acid phosphatase